MKKWWWKAHITGSTAAVDAHSRRCRTNEHRDHGRADGRNLIRKTFAKWAIPRPRCRRGDANSGGLRVLRAATVSRIARLRLPLVRSRATLHALPSRSTRAKVERLLRCPPQRERLILNT